MKKGLEIGTVGGLVVGIASIFGSFLLEGGTFGALIVIPAMMIVFGGTIATAMIGTPFANFFKIPKVMMVSIMPPKEDLLKLIDELSEYAKTVRRNSLLAMEKELKNIAHPFLRRMMSLAIDGIDPPSLRSLGETEMAAVAERHNGHASVWSKMGGYAPTMGIIGTVMGLITVLSKAGGDPTELIHGIAVAFIATLWGVFSANIIFLPICDKLKAIHAEEQLSMEVILEGVLSIQAGEAPGLTRAKLMSVLPAAVQAKDQAAPKS